MASAVQPTTVALMPAVTPRRACPRLVRHRAKAVALSSTGSSHQSAWLQSISD
jgi:hypothetical protein